RSGGGARSTMRRAPAGPPRPRLARVAPVVADSRPGEPPLPGGQAAPTGGRRGGRLVRAPALPVAQSAEASRLVPGRRRVAPHGRGTGHPQVCPGWAALRGARALRAGPGRVALETARPER